MVKISQKPRTRQSSDSRSGKVPLTYYRSTSREAAGDKSPFVRSKPRARAKKYLFGFLDVAVLGLLIIFFIHSLIVKPEPTVSANSYTYRPAEAYQLAAKAELSNFSSKNKLTIDENLIIDKLRSVFPEITSGNLELPIISQTPKLHLLISEPAFSLSDGSSSFIVSENGVVVGESANFPSLAKIPKVTDETNFKLQKGSPALNSASAKFIDYVWRHAQQANVPVSSLVLPAQPLELNLRTSDKSYYVKFYLGGDAALQTGQYLSARQQFEKDGVKPSEYLDVRVQGKIFYK